MNRVESTAIIERGALLGNNCYIGHFTVIRPDVFIDDYSEIRAHCFVAQGARIGKHVHVMQFSNICRNCIIEDKVFIGMGLITTNTRKIAYLRDYDDICEAPYIEYGVRIGAHVTILPGVRVANNCLIGAGSVLTKSTEPYGIYIGVPAKRVGDVPDDQILKETSS